MYKWITCKKKKQGLVDKFSVSNLVKKFWF